MINVGVLPIMQMLALPSAIFYIVARKFQQP